MGIIPTRERWRSRLPHWEVDAHWHFVTIRCHGSLPEAVKQQVLEIHTNLQSIEPNCEAFQQLQRQYFLTVEKYLDTGRGFAPFMNPETCQQCLQAIHAMETEGWKTGAAVVMPNHIHLLIHAEPPASTLREVLIRFKGRSAKWANQTLGRSGKFWQQDWFDRWMRHEAEVAKVVNYIRENPVKAKLCQNWEEYPYRIDRDDVC